MPRWATELPDYTEAFKYETFISQADAMRLRNDMRRLSHKRLALLYLELPTAHRTSVFAELMEAEIVDRYVEQHAAIPSLKVDL